MKLYVKANSNQELSRDYVENFYNTFKEEFNSKFGISPAWMSTDEMPGEVRIYFTNLKLRYISCRFARSDWEQFTVVLNDYNKFDKLRVMQGWDSGIWNINIPYDLIDAANLIDTIVNKLNTLASFKKYLVPAEDKSNWPSARKWRGVDTNDTEFDDMWNIWLATPEESINRELRIYPEPSIQGYSGGMFIHDESGDSRDKNGYPWYEDWQAWCEWQVNAASSSKSASEYQKRYRQHIKELCGI